MGELHYLRGPAPTQLRDEFAQPAICPAPARPAARPTYYVTAHVRDVLVVQVANPNRCLICKKQRHSNTPHHAFEPDVASIDAARALGWPTPPPEELPL